MRSFAIAALVGTASAATKKITTVPTIADCTASCEGKTLNGNDACTSNGCGGRTAVNHFLALGHGGCTSSATAFEASNHGGCCDLSKCPRLPTDPEIVRTGDAPKCEVVNGHTVVYYSNAFHPSFHCSHTNGVCSCTVHPTHNAGGCKEMVHTNGVAVQHSGDCTDTGKDGHLIANTAADWRGQNGASANGKFGIHLGKDAVGFNGCMAGGDLFSTFSFTGTKKVHFEFAGAEGGFMGYSEAYAGAHNWPIATEAYGDQRIRLHSDNQWRSYTDTVTCTYSQCRIMLEDYSGSGGSCGNVYFRNFRITD